MAWGGFCAGALEHVCRACRPSLFFGVVEGYVRVWVVSVSGQVGGRERGERRFKIFFFPASACAGEEGEQYRSKQHYFGGFF